MKVEDFDRFLSENCVKPEYILVHSLIWNGFWAIKRRPRIVSNIFRRIGRKLKSKRIYWIGLPIYWVEGIKIYFPEDMEQKVIYIDEEK